MAVHITSAKAAALIYIQNKIRDLYKIQSSLYAENENKYRLYCFRKNDVRNLLDIIYYNSDSHRLTRKYEKYVSFYGLAV